MEYPTCLGIREVSRMGRGVFATCDIAKGTIIERCPALFTPTMPQDEIFADYVFGTEGGYVSSHGWCGMYNHSDRPNATWWTEGEKRQPKKWFVIIQATRNIRAGEQIFISYGHRYFESRPHIRKHS